MRTHRYLIVLVILSIIALVFSQAAMAHPGEEAFVKMANDKYGLDPVYVKKVLKEAQKKQKIIDTMTRPAEGKPWHQYRPIFVTAKRIEAGRKFITEHKELLLRAEAETGVDPSVIAAIIGVETYFGTRTGSWRVIDALATLGFYYPKRAKFFKKELAEFLLMCQEEGFEPAEMKGSYAGAMGWGQFMPSSYRMYAIDFNGDTQRDLWFSVEDVVGSVANYLKRHHWQRGGGLVVKARETNKNHIVADGGLKPEYTISDFNGWGYEAESALDAAEKISLIELVQENRTDYWFGRHNFYVITRYNHSSMYAMAVTQLAEEYRSEFE